jgi:hypothetical protein
MGTVIKFPDEARIVRFDGRDGPDEPATVIILPVIRIERFPHVATKGQEPRTSPPGGGRRRRRASPS